MPRKPKDSAPTERKPGNLVEGPPPSIKQPFTKVSDPRAATPHGVHPLMKTQSRIEKALNDIDARKQSDETIIEKIEEEWIPAVRSMASTPNGQIFLRMMVKASGLFTPGTVRDTIASVDQKSKQDFYLRHVRPYLDKDIRAEIE